MHVGLSMHVYLFYINNQQDAKVVAYLTLMLQKWKIGQMFALYDSVSEMVRQ